MTLETVTCEGVPDLFDRAVASLRTARSALDVRTDEISAPRGVAPRAYALTAAAGPPEANVEGRLILLHDPDGQPGWGPATFRMVGFASAELAWPPVPTTVWCHWEQALDAARAGISRAAGTVTHVSSQRFGGLRRTGEPSTDHQLELRASWTPEGVMGAHLAGWCDFLTRLANDAVTSGSR